MKRAGWILSAASGLLVSACGGTGTVRMLLTDAPLDGALEVNVPIGAVEVHLAGAQTGDTSEASGPEEGRARGQWQTVVETEQRYDLLALQNGVTEVLGEEELPEGKITQIRLHLGTDSQPEMVTATDVIPLRIPSGYQTGIKLTGCFEVVAGEVTEITVDFDAGASVTTGPGDTWMLRPTIRLLTDDDCSGQ